MTPIELIKKRKTSKWKVPASPETENIYPSDSEAKPIKMKKLKPAKKHVRKKPKKVSKKKNAEVESISVKLDEIERKKDINKES